jgi:hypothetical protein
MVLLEKRIGNKENLLEVDELREELNQRYLKDSQCNLNLAMRSEQMKIRL